MKDEIIMTTAHFAEICIDMTKKTLLLLVVTEGKRYINPTMIL